MPPGAYWLDTAIVSQVTVPVLGPQRSTTWSRSLVVIDADGWAEQRACTLRTEGPGYVASPTRLRAWPKQHYRFVVRGDVVRADPGPLVLRDDVDVDGDGERGAGMTLELAVGRFVVQVASRGHTLLTGARRGDIVIGTAEVRESRQRVLSGFPIALGDGAPPQILSATWQLAPAPGVERCPP